MHQYTKQFVAVALGFTAAVVVGCTTLSPAAKSTINGMRAFAWSHSIIRIRPTRRISLPWCSNRALRSTIVYRFGAQTLRAGISSYSGAGG
jgi:hypothetical protein